MYVANNIRIIVFLFCNDSIAYSTMHIMVYLYYVQYIDNRCLKNTILATKYAYNYSRFTSNEHLTSVDNVQQFVVVQKFVCIIFINYWQALWGLCRFYTKVY